MTSNLEGFQFANAFAIAITFARWQRRSEEVTTVPYGANFSVTVSVKVIHFNFFSVTVSEGRNQIAIRFELWFESFWRFNLRTNDSIWTLAIRDSFGLRNLQFDSCSKDLRKEFSFWGIIWAFIKIFPPNLVQWWKIDSPEIVAQKSGFENPRWRSPC